MSLTAALSGPVRTRAAAEIALEDAGVAIVPDDHHSVMNWPAKLPQLPSGEDPQEPHAFLTVQTTDMEQLNRAVSAADAASWILRVHYATPAAPEPSGEQAIAATLTQMRAEIDALKARLG